MNSNLSESLRRLRLSGVLQSLNVRLQEATANRLSHAEFLELLVQDELSVRGDRAVDRRTRAAQFRDQKSLSDFDWDFNRGIRRKPIFDLASGEFVRRHTDVLFFAALLAQARATVRRLSATPSFGLDSRFIIAASLMRSVTCCTMSQLTIMTRSCRST